MIHRPAEPGAQAAVPSRGVGHEPASLLRGAKQLYRVLESVLRAADDGPDGRRLLAGCMREFHQGFQQELGLSCTWLYSQRQGRFHLVDGVGTTSHPPPPALAADRPEVLDLLEHGMVASWSPAGTRGGVWHDVSGAAPTAALLVAEPRARHILVVGFQDGVEPDAADLVLRTLRSVLSARLHKNRWGASIREAAEVQRSLLPDAAPRMEGYDIAARCLPAEDVGGDLFDFLPIHDDTLGLAVADASGHGLGAALAARDVAVGLRMAMHPEASLTNAIGRLNRVVHHGTLGGSFVSLFYGELSPDGTLLYVNAGHPPPLVLGPAGSRLLDHGDIVLGPRPEVRFRRHVHRIEPGERLVAYTDGIVERRAPDGSLFGVAGLEAAVRAAGRADAEEVAASVLATAARFGAQAPWEDDATVLVAHRLPGATAAGR